MARPEGIGCYLYRGVSQALHEANGGRLVPKAIGGRFASTTETVPLDGIWTVGESEKNAVRRHELRQEGFPTAGISTTPHLPRAKFYALGGCRDNDGVVYQIDRMLLAATGVTEHIVADTVPNPSIPEDDEVILVAADGGALPAHVVVGIIDAAT